MSEDFEKNKYLRMLLSYDRNKKNWLDLQLRTFFFLSIIGSIVYSWVTFTRKPLTVSTTHGNGSSATTLDNRKGTHNIV